MKKHLSFEKVVYVLALVATIIGFTAFSQKPDKSGSFRQEQSQRDDDTTKHLKRNRHDDSRNADLLEAQSIDLDLEMKQLDEQLQHLDEEMKHLDFSKTQKELDRAIKAIDKEKIKAQIDATLNNINWEDINLQLDKNVAKVDKIKIEEAKRQIEKARAQIENQKADMHFSVPEIDTRKIKAQTQDAMKRARKSIEKAKEEIQNLRDFTNALQSDGLIDKSKPYTIEVKKGELYINGDKQSKEVSDKYRHFYRKDNFTINMNEQRGTRI